MERNGTRLQVVRREKKTDLSDLSTVASMRIASKTKYATTIVTNAPNSKMILANYEDRKFRYLFSTVSCTCLLCLPSQ